MSFPDSLREKITIGLILIIIIGGYSVILYVKRSSHQDNETICQWTTEEPKYDEDLDEKNLLIVDSDTMAIKFAGHLEYRVEHKKNDIRTYYLRIIPNEVIQLPIFGSRKAMMMVSKCASVTFISEKSLSTYHLFSEISVDYLSPKDASKSGQIDIKETQYENKHMAFKCDHKLALDFVERLDNSSVGELMIQRIHFEADRDDKSCQGYPNNRFCFEPTNCLF